jgi:putative FmdB family regulatory protein
VPIYDYVCSACGHRFEVLRGLNEAGPGQCPLCEGPVTRAFAPPTILFKGSGWAKVDRRYSGAPSRKSGTGQVSGGDSGSSGSRESGSDGSGSGESGKRESGSGESGKRESGSGESGKRESGGRESGSGESGGRESGSGGSGETGAAPTTGTND